MPSLWFEIRRRNVVRVGIAYVLMAWVLLQAVDFGLDIIDAPNWIMQLLVLLGAIGLPAVLVFAWVYEMTPEGLKRESEINREESITHVTGRKLNTVIIGVLALAVVLLSARLLMEGEAPATAPSAATPTADSRSYDSVAVLPFADYSEAGDQEYFSKGIAEEILNLLAKTDALRVAARTSSFAFANEETDIREIGRKLDVSTVLEGSIRKSGPTLRITAQLIDVENGFHLWSETYDREATDIFRIQDEIAAAILDSLRVHLMGEEKALMVSERSDDLDAYSAYLIGKERMALRTRQDLQAAQAQFEKAIELDADYAPAHAMLAHSWLLLEQNRFGGEDLEQAEVDAVVIPHLDKALELAPDLPEAVAVKGLHDLRRYRYEEAGVAFDRALVLNPNYALAYTWRAEIAYEDERFLDMLADKERAYALDPMSLEIARDLAAEYTNFWRPQDAQRVIDRMFDLHPEHPLAFEAALQNLGNHGRYGEAALMLERALAAHPDNELFQEWNGWTYLFLGMYGVAAEVGDGRVQMLAAMMQGDSERADELLTEGQAQNPKRWRSFGRWLYSFQDGEGARQQLERYVAQDLAAMDAEGIPWRERCQPHLINDLRTIGRIEETEAMMARCQNEMEERFKAQYLCPCTWRHVVNYTILDGRLDEAVARADQWLSNGDSAFDLHLDPIFGQLEGRPEYDDFLARNQAQIERQKEIYLAGRDAAQSDAVR